MVSHRAESRGTTILKHLAFAAKLEAAKIDPNRRTVALRFKNYAKKICSGHLRAALNPTILF